jgi:hypothetical protein
VNALSAWASDESRRRTRRFLEGLSRDELQYIAEFLGSCIIDCGLLESCKRGQLAEDIARFEQCRCRGKSIGRGRDQDHKMILLLEYLCRFHHRQLSLVRRAGHA